jgi:hypothetical protein
MATEALDRPIPEAPRPLFAASGRSNTLTDMGLVLPVFVIYHLGVVLLSVRNAADPVTEQLTHLAQGHIAVYWATTLALGFGLAAVLWVAGRGETFDKVRFGLVAVEGIFFAMVMRYAAGYAVGSLPLTHPGGFAPWEGVVMSLGAGLYEEIAFRVVLFGGGALVIRFFVGTGPRTVLVLAWGVGAAMIFSGWHYFGPMADTFDLRTFTFRAVCGLVLTTIYAVRGFASAVWTHAVYDIWVLSLS